MSFKWIYKILNHISKDYEQMPFVVTTESVQNFDSTPGAKTDKK